MKVLYNQDGVAVKVVGDDTPVAKHLRAEHLPSLPLRSKPLQDNLQQLRVLLTDATGVSEQEVLEDWFGELKPMPAIPRFFIGTLTTTGDLYLIPAEHRQEWHAFDAEAEETSEFRPVPEWAQPMQGQLEHLEFEMPVEIFA